MRPRIGIWSMVLRDYRAVVLAVGDNVAIARAQPQTSAGSDPVKAAEALDNVLEALRETQAQLHHRAGTR